MAGEFKQAASDPQPNLEVAEGETEQWKLAAKTPLWAWPLLAAAVIAVSSAATVFSYMRDVPPLTLAAWRLQLTALLLCPGAVYQYRTLTADMQEQAKQSGLLMLASGGSLAFHFALWVWGILHTSLTHALLFVSITPVLIAASMWLLRQPISAGEIIGTVLGMVGGLVLAVGGASEGEVTLLGDLACITASTAVIMYLSIGRKLRSWMPLFVYAFPVTGAAAGFLTFGAVAFGGASVTAAGNDGAAGWLGSHYWPLVAYLAVGPGIVGHTSFNLLLKYMHPLAIALPLALEPVIGSVIGWAAGLAGLPGPLTYAGGAILLGATLLVTVAGHRREAAEKQGPSQQHAEEAAV